MQARKARPHAGILLFLMTRDVSRLGFAAIVAALAMPAFTQAATVGPSDIEETGFAQSCFDQCTFTNATLPSAVGLERSPITGKIKRWRVNVADGEGPLRLQVLKRTHNEPGTANDEFVAVRETGKSPVTGAGEQVFDADIRIRKGQFIGLGELEDGFGTHIGFGEASGADFIDFEPPLAPGESPRTTSNLYSGSPDQYLLFNATVRR